MVRYFGALFQSVLEGEMARYFGALFIQYKRGNG